MSMEKCREKIDKIDKGIVSLLNERLEVAGEIGKIKAKENAPVYFPGRQEKLLRKLESLNAGKLSKEGLRAVYREIISCSIACQKPLSIVYLGPETSYTQQAAFRNFGSSCTYIAMPNMGEVFRAIEEGEANYGVVPVYHFSESSVGYPFDQFVDSDLKIIAEVGLNREDDDKGLFHFFVLGNSVVDAANGCNFKTSVLFALENEAGALEKVLRVLSEKQINVLKIESQPTRKNGWGDLFFADIDGHFKDAAIQESVAVLREVCSYFKWLGSYPSIV